MLQIYEKISNYDKKGKLKSSFSWSTIPNPKLSSILSNPQKQNSYYLPFHIVTC